MDSAQGYEAQIQKLEQSLQASKLPPELLEKAHGMIEVLKISLRQGGNYSNFESAANYIKIISEIPFEYQANNIPDLSHSNEILNRNHYGLQQAKDRILEYLASLVLNMRNGNIKVTRAPILCLVGLVGTGKTTLAYSVAEALRRPFERIPLGGMGDVRSLRGQSRLFADAEPGQIVKKLIHAKSRNGVILLDEMDRITESARGDVMGALIELLDPEQNGAFTDHYVDYPVDLSDVLFIATANNTTNISTAVLDRLELIQMPSYTDEEKLAIGKNYLFPRIVKASGLPDNLLKIDESVWPMVIRPLGYDSGIRSLERTIEGICRKVARLLIEGKIQQNGIITLTSQNISQFLPN